jgi:hypothetical protein
MAFEPRPISEIPADVVGASVTMDGGVWYRAARHSDGSWWTDDGDDDFPEEARQIEPTHYNALGTLKYAVTQSAWCGLFQAGAPD